MKTLKKILAALMAIMLAFSLAACQEEEKEIPPAGSTAMGTGGIKIGMLYTSELEKADEEDVADAEVEADEDAPLDVNFAHRNGIAIMQGYLGVPAENIIEANSLSATDEEKFNEKIAELVKGGCHVIVATSYDYFNLIEKVAAKEAYKGIVFAVFADSNTAKTKKLNNTNNNLMLFGVDMFEASYLAGIAAGLKSGDKTIGYVAPDDKDIQVVSAINAFTLGAQSVNEKAKVMVSVVKDWTNEKAVDTAVKALESAKCVAVSKFVETDDDAFCSTVWHLENVYIPVINTIARGEWTPENYFGGITEGAVDVKIGEDAAKGTKDAVNEAKEDIMDGELVLNVADGGKFANGVSLLK